MTDYEEPRLTRREAMQGTGVALGSLVATGSLTDTVMAQSGGPTNEISGIVEDESGAVDGATVVAVPHDTSLAALETTTASDGTYQFAQSDLHEGENLYHVIARDGTESNPRRGEQQYPFVAAEGAAAIPDSDLTQYSLTDPNGYISAISSNSYEAQLADGANSTSRLYSDKAFADFPETFRYTFDIEVTSADGVGERSCFGFAPESDSTNADVSAFAGGQVGHGGSSFTDLAFSISSFNHSPTLITDGLSLNTVYSLEYDYDRGANEITGTVFNGSTEVASATASYPSASYGWHYAHQALDAGFDSPGHINFDVTNHRFEAI